MLHTSNLPVLPFLFETRLKEEVAEISLLLLEWYKLYQRHYPPKDEVDIQDLQALSLRYFDFLDFLDYWDYLVLSWTYYYLDYLDYLDLTFIDA